MRFLSAILVVLALAWPAISVAQTGGDWHRVAPLGEHFVVKMPSEPERSVKKTSTFAGTVEDVSYRARHRAGTYIATRVDLPGVATFFMSDDSLLEEIRKSFLEQGDGVEKSYMDVERDGYAGKKLDFIRKMPDGDEDARAEFFVVEGQMLSFTGIVPQGHSMEDIDRFLATIDITED